MLSADDYIRILGLNSHVEGGAFKEIYRAELLLPQIILPETFKGSRHAATSIYFLLKYGQFSAFHRIASDECWHFYDGAPLHIYEITTEGNLITHILGRNIVQGETFHTVIKAGSWFASRCETENAFSLVGCTVAPGFDFEDFELGSRQNLTSQYPQHTKLIEELTPN